MGVRFFGNVKLPTLRFSITVPALGPALFEAENFSDHLSLYTFNSSVPLSNVFAYLDEQPSTSLYFDNGISFTSNTLNANKEISRLVAYLDEEPNTSSYYVNGIQFTSNTLNTNKEIAQLVAYLDEEPTDNIIYDANELNF